MVVVALFSRLLSLLVILPISRVLARLIVELIVFFFQAEDGIRDGTVTGVQTCALPISGIVATTVLFSGAFTAMYGTFIKYQFQHTYDAILAAPVDTEELVTGEALWIGLRKIGRASCRERVEISGAAVS